MGKTSREVIYFVVNYYYLENKKKVKNNEIGLYTWLNLERKFSLAQEISFVSEFLPHRDISLAEEIVQLRHNKNKPGSGCFGSVVDRKTRLIYFWLPCC